MTWVNPERVLLITRSMLEATVVVACSATLLAQTESPPAFSRSATVNGTRITVDVGRLDSSQTPADPVREFEKVRIRLRLRDANSGSPLAGASPAAWMDRHGANVSTSESECIGKVKRFAEGSTFSHTALDLTSFHVVLLNADPSITVVDPRFSYGDSRLLAMVRLDGPGRDWAMADNGDRLFVSVPSAEKVVAIDTASWTIVGEVTPVPNAGRVVLQPDQAYVWAAYNTPNASGVTVIDAVTMKIVRRIETGRGDHDIVLSGDSSTAFVTNTDDGTVSVIDVRRLERVSNVGVGSKPVSIAFSSLARAAFVTSAGEGKIVSIDEVTHRIRATISATPGLGQIRFAPGERFALAVNPTDDSIVVIDAASDRIVQRGKLDAGPDAISFTNKQAHIRHRGSDAVLMIALASLGKPNQSIAVADFSGGRHAPGKMSLPSPADSIVQASGENAVLVANPGDASVYLYMEGAAAPMGSFSNDGHEPRAVLSVDRNLRERSPGVYETTATIPREGDYDFALFLERPRIVACFDFPVAPDSGRAHVKTPDTRVEPQISSGRVGEAVHLAFRLTEVKSGKPDQDVPDVVVLMMGPSWQRRDRASYRGDGVYAVDFSVPTPGTYSVLLTAPSLGLPYSRYGTVDIVAETK